MLSRGTFRLGEYTAVGKRERPPLALFLIFLIGLMVGLLVSWGTGSFVEVSSGAAPGEAAVLEGDPEGDPRLVLPPAKNLSGESWPPRIVVSISTFPGRVELISDTINSILAQTMKADRIHLHIPKEVRRLPTQPAEKLPPIVAELEQRHPDLISVHRPDDYGPATKLLGALLIEKDPDTVIITLDDDTTYHKNLFRNLMDTLQKHPRCIPCYVCDVWSFEKGDTARQMEGGFCHGWAFGFSGAAYKVGWFDRDVFKIKEVHEGCWSQDDVFISGYLYRRGIYPYNIVPDLWRDHKAWTNLSVFLIPDAFKRHRDPCVAAYNYFK